jgi:Na+/H+ antiporter NhaC
VYDAAGPEGLAVFVCLLGNDHQLYYHSMRLPLIIAVSLGMIVVGATALLYGYVGLAAAGRYFDECPGGSDCSDAQATMTLGVIAVAAGAVVIAVLLWCLRRLERQL